MKKMIYFIGSIPFAIATLILLIIMTTLGAFLESFTQSHLLAERYTYDFFLYKILFSLIFLNILAATLKRYPFSKKQIPFLLTHLGLLILILGVILKSFFSTQGTMILTEGTSSNTIFNPSKIVLNIENRENRFTIPLSSIQNKNPFLLNNLQIECTQRYPHGTSSLEFFVHDKIKSDQDPFLLAQEYYKKEASLIINDGEYPINTLIRRLIFDENRQKMALSIEGGSSTLSLSGSSHVKIMLKPKVLLIENSLGYWHLFYFLRSGFILSEKISSYPIFAINDGYDGFLTKIGWSKALLYEDRETLLQKLHQLFENELRVMVGDFFKNEPLFSSLKDRLHAQSQTIESFMAKFLIEWQMSGSYLNPNESPLLDFLDFSKQNTESLRATHLLALILYQADQEGKFLDEIPLLFIHNWLKNDPTLTLASIEEMSTKVLTNLPPTLDIENNIFLPKNHLLSAFLLSKGISPSLFNPSVLLKNNSYLEDPLFSKAMLNTQETTAPLKQEDHTPIYTITFRSHEKEECVDLIFNARPGGIKWPILDGKYLINLQPEEIKIPHKIRLRQAKEIYYPHTKKPMNYEADIVDDNEEITIKMNSPYVTEDGFKFYLSSIIQNDDTRARIAIFSVDKDPVKKLFLYPGAIILIFGIILLFRAKG